MICRYKNLPTTLTLGFHYKLTLGLYIFYYYQVSGDEQRRLCGEHAKYSDRTGLGLGVGLTTYGSVAYQLKDANMEASSTVDFVCRAAKIMNRTSKLCF